MYLCCCIVDKWMPEQEDLFQELVRSFHVCCIHKNLNTSTWGMQNTCMHNTAYIHTAYISATLLHILGMYTAYILHTCTPAHVTHVCCTRAAHTIHPYCIHAHTQKLVQRHTHAIQAYEEMHAVCVQLFTCSMYAVYNSYTHLAYIHSDVCDLMCMYVACV